MVCMMMNSGKDALGGATDWLTSTIKASIVATSGYTFPPTHDRIDDVPSGARLSTITLSGKTLSNGVYSATSPLNFPSVTGASQGLFIWHDTGTESTSPLIGWIDGLILVTIARTSSGSTTFNIDPLLAAISSTAVLTRLTGTGVSTITLNNGSNAVFGDRALTANANVSVVAGDTYSVPIINGGFPLSDPGGGSVIININGTRGLIYS